MTPRESIMEQKIEREYWIDLYGKSHKYKGQNFNIRSVHYEIADALYPESDDPKTDLFKLGWVCIGHTV